MQDYDDGSAVTRCLLVVGKSNRHIMHQAQDKDSDIQKPYYLLWQRFRHTETSLSAVAMILQDQLLGAGLVRSGLCFLDISAHNSSLAVSLSVEHGMCSTHAKPLHVHLALLHR